jgi:hypothetical protein
MTNKVLFFAAFVCLAALSSCSNNNGNQGRSTPIDSTNLNGTAPATYDGDNPANDADTNYKNSNDTGTRLSNGPDNTVDPNGNNQNKTNNQ